MFNCTYLRTKLCIFYTKMGKTVLSEIETNLKLIKSKNAKYRSNTKAKLTDERDF